MPRHRKPPTPHDALFRAIFGRPHHAVTFARALLPTGLAELLDWSAVADPTTEMPDGRLYLFRSDLVLRVPYRNGSGHLLIGIEHQSSPDDRLPYRQLRYGILGTDRHLRETDELALYYPLVLSHGRRASPCRRLTEATSAPSAALDLLAGRVADYALDVLDLTTMREADLLRLPVTPLVRLTLLLFRFVRARDLGSRLQRWLPHFAAVAAEPDGWDALEPVAAYLIEAGGVDPRRLADYIRTMGPKAEEVVMSAAEKLRAEGRAEGYERGLAKGRRLFLRQLTLRFGVLPDWVAEAVDALDEDALGVIAERIVTAPTLEAVFER